MRTIVVTGGGTGIGRSVASRLRAHDTDVIITGRRIDVLRQTAASLGAARAVELDATDPTAVEAFAQELGDVAVLVNNAGGNTDFDHSSPTGLAELAAAWRRNLDSNLISAVLMTEGLLPKMGRGSSVISIGSIAADKGAGSYGAAKAGLASWNIDLARRVGERGITANIVSPGFIGDTEFFRDVLDDAARQSLVSAAITGRAGTPDDIANIVAFLASDESRQITAQTFAVNGGEHATR